MQGSWRWWSIIYAYSYGVSTRRIMIFLFNNWINVLDEYSKKRLSWNISADNTMSSAIREWFKNSSFIDMTLILLTYIIKMCLKYDFVILSLAFCSPAASFYSF